MTRRRKSKPSPPIKYLEQLARYWKKKRKPLHGPEPSQSRTMWYLTREPWYAKGSRSSADLTISWSANEPKAVAVNLYYDDEATSDKQRWFEVGTPSAKLWEYAKDPGIGTLGRATRKEIEAHIASRNPDYGWKRSSHAESYKEISPQKARAYLTEAHGKNRKLPRPGHEIRLDRTLVLVNLGGRYEVHLRPKRTRRNPGYRKSGIIIDVSEDGLGVTLTPRSEKVRAQMRRHNKEWTGNASDNVFLQEWRGDEFLDSKLSPSQARDVRGGWPVGIKMDPWEFAHYDGYDFHEVINP
jgi:hypothetical protein